MTRRALLASLLACCREIGRTLSWGARWARRSLLGDERPGPDRSRLWRAVHWLGSWRRSRARRRRAALVGSRLRTTRERSTLTQEEIARRAGIGLDFYRRLESGDPTALRAFSGDDLLWSVAEALGTTPGQLLQGLG